MKRLLLPAAVLVAVVGSTVATAGADPVNSKRVDGPFEVACPDQTFENVVGNGNGEFTPGHDLESTTMLIPVAFGTFTGTLYDAQGNAVDTFTEDGFSAKGQSVDQVPGVVACTFSFTEVSDGSDPDGPPAGFTFVGGGEVWGLITPARH